MLSYYTVLQYVPDVVADERINVGVIAYGADQLSFRFLKDWRRAGHFAEGSADHVRRFIEQDLRAALQTMAIAPPESSKLDEAWLRSLTAGRWLDQLVVTVPKPSTKKPDELLSRVFVGRLMREREQVNKVRTKRQAATLARGELLAGFRHRLGVAAARDVVRQHVEILGRRTKHLFDVAAVNGSVRLALQALSFEPQETPELRREVDSTFWSITDVREKNAGVLLAVATLPPKTATPLYAETQRVLRGLGAKVLEEGSVRAWAKDQARLFAPAQT